MCVSLAAGLATIKIDKAAASGAKSLGLVLGVCFIGLAVLSVVLRVRKRLRPKPPTPPSPGLVSAGPAQFDAGAETFSPGPAGYAFQLPVTDVPPTVNSPGEDPLDRIAKLAQLRDSEALTEAEFEREKTKPAITSLSRQVARCACATARY